MFDLEKKIIESVKKHVCLYNNSHFDIQQPHKIQTAWVQVSIECGLPVDQVENRWVSLRKRFIQEFNKCIETDSMTSSWTHYKRLSFLISHIKLRRDRYELYERDMEMAYDGSSRQQRIDYNDDQTVDSYASDLGLEIPNYEDVFSTEDVLSVSTDTLQQPPQGLQQAQEDFHKVMGLLQSTLEQNLKEQTKSWNQPKAPQDPFYKYLESILSRVKEDNQRADIQLELLTIANTLVKESTAQNLNL